MEMICFLQRLALFMSCKMFWIRCLLFKCVTSGKTFEWCLREQFWTNRETVYKSLHSLNIFYAILYFIILYIFTNAWLPLYGPHVMKPEICQVFMLFSHLIWFVNWDWGVLGILESRTQTHWRSASSHIAGRVHMKKKVGLLIFKNISTAQCTKD